VTGFKNWLGKILCPVSATQVRNCKTWPKGSIWAWFRPV